MRIQHNIPSMNAYRNFSNNSKSINKNLEKLSSGYKINRAGDDAAGLAISEKMRAQISGLEVAQKNAKDGISLIQTAEGALTEVHDMLNRMYKLAEQSANGTYDASVDRQQLQKEVVSLRTEIDRIGQSANFNGTKLLDGTLSGAAATLDATDTTTDTTEVTETGETEGTSNSGGKIEASISNVGTLSSTTTSDSVTLLKAGSKPTISWEDGTAEDDIASLKGTTLKLTVDSEGTGLEADGTTTLGNFTVGTISVDTDAGTATVNLLKGTDAAGSITMTLDSGDDFSNIPVILSNLDERVSAEISFSEAKGGAEGFTANGEGTALTLQIGDDSSSYNQLHVSIDAIDTSQLGEFTVDEETGVKTFTGTTSVADIDISEQGKAQLAMDTIKAAINYVSDTRGGLGALQNRLEHTINNLSVMQENMQDAESTIRDTDVAEEMMKYTKNNILVQSAQAMLAQANQLPQGVLQLLQ